VAVVASKGVTEATPNVRCWGAISRRTLGVSSTSRAAHEAEDWSSEMLERRTALESLSSNRSMMQAYVLCRMGTRTEPLDDVPATYDDLVQAGLADPGRYDPERPLVDAAESERVQKFCASLPPGTRETIEAEMQRQDEGALASDAFRQRLRRARERARPHTRRFGLQPRRRSR
jgi:hypothetical protein